LKIGIFAKTFRRPTVAEVLQAVADSGIYSVQFNLACAGLESLPENAPTEVVQDITRAANKTKIELSALSGTFNMAHPDQTVRQSNLARFALLCEIAGQLGIPIVTLCTGTRDPLNMWKWHAANDSKEAWNDMVQSIEFALIAAEKSNVTLAFEPESENIVNSARRARKLLDQLQSSRLRVVIDPANLVSAGCNQKDVLDETFFLLGNTIAIAHAKDRDHTFRACAAGKGILDFGYYIRCLKHNAFDGPLIMHGLEEEDVVFSRDFLERALLSGSR
jgi:sugar phosphate isomerase/epimerase